MQNYSLRFSFLLNQYLSTLTKYKFSLLWETKKRRLRHRLDATEGVSGSLFCNGWFQMENAICAVHLPRSLEVSSQLDMDSTCPQSFWFTFLKAYISITSKPAHLESKLKEVKVFYVPARATTDIAPNSNSFLLKKGWNKNQQQNRETCLLPGLPTAVTIQMFCTFWSSNSIPFSPFFCKPFSSIFEQLRSLLLSEQQQPTSLQNEVVAYSHLFRCCF